MTRFKDTDEAYGFISKLPWGTAAGTCRDQKTALAFASVGIPIVRFGSVIMEKGWGGNPGDNFWYDEKTRTSINAMGLGDPGLEHHLTYLPQLRRQVNARGSKLCVSFSSRLKFDPIEYRFAAQRIVDSGAADMIEGNFACPNNEDANGRRKPLTCLDPVAFNEGVAAFSKGAQGCPSIVKVAPITEPRILEEQLDICSSYGITYMDCANTMGNSYLEKPDGTPAISMKRGGLAGRALVPIVSGMLMTLVPLAKSKGVKILATGGVDCGQVAYDYLKLGAAGFSFNTAVTKPGGGPNSIAGILDGNEYGPGLLQLMVERGLPD